MDSSIDWNLLKYMYEVHGATEQELASENGVSEHMVKYVKEQQRWKKSKLAESIQDWTDVEDYKSEELMDDIQQRMSAMSLLKQVSVNPKIQILETAIIGKAIDAVNYMDSSMPNSANILCKLGELLSALKESNPALRALNKKTEEVSSGNNFLKVQIVTRYADDRKEVIEVSASDQIEDSSITIPPSNSIPFTTLSA